MFKGILTLALTAMWVGGWFLFVKADKPANLSVGSVAPDFSLKNQNGELIGLQSLKGKFVLLYFYPKDQTPGCTIEACKLNNSFDKFREKNIVILGLNNDNEKSHQKFISKHDLKFDLLIDKEGKTINEYEASGIFVKRKSYLIGPDQRILKIYESVNPFTHAEDVLADIDAIELNSKS